MKNALMKFLYRTSESATVPLIVLGAFGWFVSMFAQMAGIKSNKKLSEDKKKFLLAQEKNEGICNIGLYVLFTSTLASVSESLYKKGKILSAETKKILDTFADKNGLSSIDDVFKNAKKAKKSVVDYIKSVDKNIDITPFTRKSGLGVAATIVASILSCNIVTPIIKNKMAYHALKKQEAKIPKQPITTKPQVYNTPQVFQNSKAFSGILKV